MVNDLLVDVEHLGGDIRRVVFQLGPDEFLVLLEEPVDVVDDAFEFIIVLLVSLLFRI